ncbi:MAG: protein phosphatase CheZ [Desulfovibrionaceae bacterium]|jgi:chemotaxis protein CheZ|nr:protein phosphatase CheZ [Desulfovibrionaceae bacterium]
MITQETLIQEILNKVSEQVSTAIAQSVTQTIEQELSKNLTNALVESELYRKITTDMRQGLQSIYKEISEATRSSEQTAERGEAHQLFHEASRQLGEVLQATEKATVNIMDVVEENMQLQAEGNELLGKLYKTRKHNDNIKALFDLNTRLGDNQMAIMEALSFQDITGQRIKRIIEALGRIEQIVLDLYVSTGLILKARETAPDKTVDALAREAQDKLTELKGPDSKGKSQADVDDLLSQLGFD